MCARVSSATQLRDLALGLRGSGGGDGTLAAASAARPAAPDAQRDMAATDGSEPSPVPKPPAGSGVRCQRCLGVVAELATPIGVQAWPLTVRNILAGLAVQHGKAIVCCSIERYRSA
jgi:hypothetical protein